MSAVGPDVTAEVKREQERERLAAEVRRAGERLQRVVDLSVDLFATVSPDGEVLSAGPRCDRLLGWAAADLVGQRLADLFVGDDADRAWAAFQAVCNGAPATNVRSRLRDKSGQRVPVEWSAATWDDDAVLFVARDVSSQIELERQLVHGQKLEAVGRLTGGVAHDFNNLLAVIVGSLETLADGECDLGTVRTLAAEALAAAEKGAQLTTHLLAFARRQPLQPEPVDVDRLVAGMQPLLRRTLEEHIRIDFTASEGGAHVMVDPAQLESAVLNLAINARDAMPDGGRLSLLVRVDPAEPPEGCVLIEVADTGVGMPEEVLAHAFEPFFTTKEAGEGSGMGLSMVYGFARQSGGLVRAVSAKGEGTTVTIQLPLRQEAPARLAAPASLADPSPDPGGCEHLLIVEDDASVRMVLREQLLSLGYEVTEACDGAEALRLLQDGLAPALVLSDIVMPGGMSGRDLAREAAARWPGLPVLLTSGYEDPGALGPREPVVALRKPYRRSQLATTVRAALDGSPQG